MNRTYTILLILVSIFVFSACQKELNFDRNTQSVGSLKIDSATLDCLPSTVRGVYQEDSLLGTGNTIDVQVNITSPGVYEILSDTVNGYWFYGTGTVGNTGINTIRLYGSGTPVNPGNNSFVITYRNNNSSCTVDVSVQPSVGSGNTQAQYSFGGAGGTCTGSTLSGTYMQGLVLTTSNTATVNITVTNPGTFTMSTPVVNGVSFAASGTLNAGSTAVTLTASGTPTVSGTFNFPVTGGGSSCIFPVTFSPAVAPAVFTLGGAPNGCTGAILNGTYNLGTPMNAGNTVAINVNVTTAGSYSMATTSIVGLIFSATGVFTTTGPQTITLTASGTPNNSGTYAFPVNHAGTSCLFNVTISGTPTDFITCKIDGVFTTFNINASAGLDNSTGFPILSIDGSSVNTSFDPSISLGITKAFGGSIVPGTYTVNQSATGITLGCDYTDAAGTSFLALTDINNQNQNPAFTIIITSFTASRLVGSFSGPVKDNNGAGPGIKNITEGVFNVPVQ